ncbi:MAG: tetratricopeptide repeat protein [SAR324 cluster bacterium]|nr:tetratricopeptide repeat protein [SAR324 cluster bacterium]MBL7034539.1 tetratricopeptide repeat protein [SAR324 cluster bacterium]
MSCLKIIKLIPLFLIFGLISCTNKLQFSTSIAPSADLNSIRTLAIGDVRLLQNEELVLNDNRGNWRESVRKFTTNGLEKLVKRSLISNLSRYSAYNIVDLAVFSTIFSDKLKTVKPVGGLKIKGIDAVLNLRIGIKVISQKGQFESVKSFRRHASRKSGKKWITTEDSSMDRKITETYQTRTVTVLLSGELLKVSAGKIKLLSTFSEVALISKGNGIAPTSFAQSLAGNLSSFFSGDERSKEEKISNLPFLDLKHLTQNAMPNAAANLAQRLALQITNMILPKLSRYTVLATRTIDAGGDGTAVEYLKLAEVLKAKKRIEEVISNPDEKTAENLYNLGICYEALGDPSIAMQLYEEALELDQANSNIIEALGALQDNRI